MAQSLSQRPVTLPPLESIIQNMIDANESEENIASVIQHYKGSDSIPPTKLEGQPTDFWGGVKQSFTSGEAGNAMDEGARGWLKGAITDLPGSIMGGLSSIGNLISDPGNTIKNIPSDIMNMGRGIKDTFMQAGSNPGAFGEMMGQVGGQPLVTAGIAKGVPMMRNPVGRGIEMVGDVMQKHQPISGMLPRIAEMRTMRNVEKAVGRGVSKVGNKIQKPPVIQGEIVPPPEPNFTDADFMEVPPEGSPQLPKSDTIYPPRNTTETRQYRMLPENKPLGLPPSDTSFYGNISIQDDPSKLLPRFGGSSVNPLITKSLEAPHPLDELVNSLKLDPGALTSIDENNNIISNFQKRQIPDTLQKAPESPVAGPISEPPTDIENLIAQLQNKGEPKMGHGSPIPEPVLEANPVEISTSKSKLKSGDTIVHTGPDEFKDMKVWHNIGKNKYKPEFQTDLDKIKFLAGQVAPSKNLSKYLKFIIDQTGMDEASALSSAREFRLHAKELMEGKKPGVIKIPSIGGR